jgi:tetratricopeptide (TPR) repeat protein
MGSSIRVAAVAVGAAVTALGQTAWQDAKATEKVVFFSGSVMMDDGTAPIEPVSIERVCDGRAQFAAWTDLKGRFSFKVASGGSDATSGDASVSGGGPTNLNMPLNGTASQYSNPITTELRNCELQAVLSGYRSQRVSMAIKSMMDDARVGTIILHPLSRATTLTVSATTLEAPANARKAYEKGLEELREQKRDSASAEFGKAVKLFPRFAVAWYQLGQVRQSGNDIAGAVEAWKQAQQSDPRYVRPYESLTALADRKGDWTESEKYSRLWLALDAEDFPAAYLFNAVANAQLKKPEDAERAAREGLRVDKEHRLPRLNYVLGLILMDKKQYGESAQSFRKYLELAPNAHDAPVVRAQLPKLEEMAAAPPAK